MLPDTSYDHEREAAIWLLRHYQKHWGKPSPDNLLEVARRFAPGFPRTEADRDENDEETLVRSDKDEAQDTTFALAALSVLRTPETPSVLLPYLASSCAEERWLATFGLAAIQDERVLPELERTLVGFVGPHDYHFLMLRHHLLHLLADWGDPRLAPPIRAGLIATVQAEEVEVPEPQEPEEEFVWNGRCYTGSGVRQRFYGLRSTVTG